MSSNTFNKKSFTPLAISLACFYWIADTIVNVFLLKTSLSFLESFIMPTPAELWSRISAIIIIILISVYTKKYCFQLEKEIYKKQDIEDEFKYLEVIDPITLLINKRKLHELLEYEMEKDKRYKQGLSIIFCDVDNIDTINAEQKPEFCRSFALQLVTALRKSDIVSRWGEEGFLILIPNKNAEETKVIIEKVKDRIHSYDFLGIGKITVSFGVTQYQEGDNKISIVERAESAFKKAKENGANSTEVIS